MRALAIVLDEWRLVERQLDERPPGSPAATSLRKRSDSLRAEYIAGYRSLQRSSTRRPASPTVDRLVQESDQAAALLTEVRTFVEERAASRPGDARWTALTAEIHALSGEVHRVAVRQKTLGRLAGRTTSTIQDLSGGQPD